MATHVISQEELDEFIDEAPTQRVPTLMLRVQDQVNAARSVASFIATANSRQEPKTTEPISFVQEHIHADVEELSPDDVMELS